MATHDMRIIPQCLLQVKQPSHLINRILSIGVVSYCYKCGSFVRKLMTMCNVQGEVASHATSNATECAERPGAGAFPSTLPQNGYIHNISQPYTTSVSLGLEDKLYISWDGTLFWSHVSFCGHVSVFNAPKKSFLSLHSTVMALDSSINPSLVEAKHDFMNLAGFLTHIIIIIYG